MFILPEIFAEELIIPKQKKIQSFENDFRL